MTISLKKHIILSKQTRKIFQAIRKEKISVNDRVEIMKSLDIIRCFLDDDYHSEITEKQYRKLGHIYYGGRTQAQKMYWENKGARQ